MTQVSAPPEQPRGRLERLRGAANSATLRGGAGVAIGLGLLLVPGLSEGLVEIAVGIGLLVSGVSDLWYAASGKGRSGGSRLLALFRGPASLLFAALVVLVPRDGLGLLIEVVGIYLIVRAVLTAFTVVLSRDRQHAAMRLSTAAASLGFGVLALLAPSTTEQGLIIGGALTAIVVGAIVFSHGLSRAHDGVGLEGTDAPVGEILWDWVRGADVGDQRREALADSLYFEEPGRLQKLTAWWVMLLLSVSIATFAVLQDSTAVVIGAMLVAPLMVPILGLSGALVNGWRSRVGSSAGLLAAGVAASVVLSNALSSWAPIAVAYETNTQITSRINPTLLDMAVAVAAGAAGAFATVNVRVASSIAGVAIAVALVPPLSVVGISLGGQRYDDAGGAMLLFLTNFVAIVLSAAVVFVLAGFAQPDLLRLRSRKVLVTIAPFGALAALILLPLVFTSQGLLATSTAERQSQEVVTEWLGPDSTLRVESVAVADGLVEVELTGESKAPPLEPLQAALTDALEAPVGVKVSVAPVRVTQLPVPPEPSAPDQG